jgi:hypothetical protein
MGDETTEQFAHPDPDIDPKLPKLQFCQYWEESWGFDPRQKIDNPMLVVGAQPVSISSIPSLPTVTTSASFATSTSIL